MITTPDRTQLNSTGSWVELSWVELSSKEWSHRVRRCDHSLELNSTEIVQFCVSRVSLNKFIISTTSWVELSWVWSGGVITRTTTTNQFDDLAIGYLYWVLSDVSLTASVTFNFSAISWTAFFCFINSLLLYYLLSRTTTQLYQHRPTPIAPWLRWSDVIGVVWFLSK